MQITINVPDNLPFSFIQTEVKKFEEKLRKAKVNVKEIIEEEDLKIDTAMCLKTLEKIKRGDFSGFTEITDIDAHIQSLKDDIN